MGQKDHPTRRGGNRARGFTLVDVLVTLAVITILIGILLPSFTMVRESARRVICASNLRQAGLGLNMYAQGSNEWLPPSVFLPASNTRGSSSAARPDLMDTLRTSRADYADRAWGQWDGLGLMYQQGILTAPQVFYCPSHPGAHPFSRYERAWTGPEGEIVSNYQYRGIGPDGQRRLFQIPTDSALVTDTLRSYTDLNHQGGFNLLQAGLAVTWFEDVGNEIADLVARTSGGISSSQAVTDAWDRMDGSTSGAGGTSGLGE
jgi:type II secretory pathway pseudopilin PulG